MRPVSFEGTDTERTVALRHRPRRRGRRRIRKRLPGRRSIASDIVQESRGRHKEQIAGLGETEIEQTIAIAGWAADEHIFQHLLDGSRRTRIADEVGAELLIGYAAERHVVTDDLNLLAILDDRGQ